MRRLVLACLLAAAALTAAPVSYVFQVDTSSIAAAGNLEFVFNPGGGSDPATALISLWSSDATLGAVTTSGGPVTGGPLPADVTINNAGFPNSYLQAVSAFGAYMQFKVTIDVPVVSGSATSGSTFAFYLWNETLDDVLLPTDESSGALLTIDVDTEGIVGPPVIWNRAVSEVSEVPEPATFALAGAGLLALLSRSFRRAR